MDHRVPWRAVIPTLAALRVLLVEDSEDDAALIAAHLAREPRGIDLLRVASGAALDAALAAREWDIVISDYNLPGFGGLEALERVRRHSAGLPFILVSATVGEEVAVEAMRLGADDYVMKSGLARLVPAVRREVGESYERRAQQDRIERLSRVKAVMSGINALLVRVRERGELFREACRIAVEDGGFLAAWVGEVGGSPEPLRAAASHAATPAALAPLFSALRDPRAYASACEVPLAVARGMACASNDLERESPTPLRAVAGECGARSMAAIPVMVRGRVAAVFVFYAAEPGFFDDEEMRLLAEMTGDIAFALDVLAKQDRLEHLAYYDPLTGLANHRLLVDRLAQSLDASAHEGTRVAVFMLDIDRFRNVNDTLGRQAGDTLLRQVAARFGDAAGSRGSPARPGSDHFVALLPSVRHDHEIEDALERLARCFATPFMIGGASLTMSASIGVSIYPGDGLRPEDLLRNAETAAERAKASGDRHLFYAEEMTARIAGKLEMEIRLRRAIEREEFILHYQPKVDTKRRRIVGLEALLRWRGPDGAWIPPSDFVPVLEETGLIVEVGTWVIARAVRDQARLAARMVNAPRVAVNVSTKQLRRADFTAWVKSALGAGPPRIDLEIVESLALDDVEAAVVKLTEIRALGIGIAIDDFGTGYSSLSYLARLPVETLKIDRSFIAAMLDEAHAKALVAAIVSLAHSLGMQVVAEGVETEQHAHALLAMSCDQLQGYLTGRPMPIEDLEARLLEEWGEPANAPH